MKSRGYRQVEFDYNSMAVGDDEEDEESAEEWERWEAQHGDEEDVEEEYRWEDKIEKKWFVLSFSFFFSFIPSSSLPHYVPSLFLVIPLSIHHRPLFIISPSLMSREKGGSGLNFYTDAIYWDKQKGDKEEREMIKEHGDDWQSPGEPEKNDTTRLKEAKEIRKARNSPWMKKRKKRRR